MIVNSLPTHGLEGFVDLSKQMNRSKQTRKKRVKSLKKSEPRKKSVQASTRTQVTTGIKRKTGPLDENLRPEKKLKLHSSIKTSGLTQEAIVNNIILKTCHVQLHPLNKAFVNDKLYPVCGRPMSSSSEVNLKPVNNLVAQQAIGEMEQETTSLPRVRRLSVGLERLPVSPKQLSIARQLSTKTKDVHSESFSGMDDPPDDQRHETSPMTRRPERSQEIAVGDTLVARAVRKDHDYVTIYSASSSEWSACELGDDGSSEIDPVSTITNSFADQDYTTDEAFEGSEDSSTRGDSDEETESATSSECAMQDVNLLNLEEFGLSDLNQEKDTEDPLTVDLSHKRKECTTSTVHLKHDTKLVTVEQMNMATSVMNQDKASDVVDTVKDVVTDKRNELTMSPVHLKHNMKLKVTVEKVGVDNCVTNQDKTSDVVDTEDVLIADLSGKERGSAVTPVDKDVTAEDVGLAGSVTNQDKGSDEIDSKGLSSTRNLLEKEKESALSPVSLEQGVKLAAMEGDVATSVKNPANESDVVDIEDLSDTDFSDNENESAQGLSPAHLKQDVRLVAATEGNNVATSVANQDKESDVGIEGFDSDVPDKENGYPMSLVRQRHIKLVKCREMDLATSVANKDNESDVVDIEGFDSDVPDKENGSPMSLVRQRHIKLVKSGKTDAAISVVNQESDVVDIEGFDSDVPDKENGSRMILVRQRHIKLVKSGKTDAATSVVNQESDVVDIEGFSYSDVSDGGMGSAVSSVHLKQDEKVEIVDDSVVSQGKESRHTTNTVDLSDSLYNEKEYGTCLANLAQGIELETPEVAMPATSQDKESDAIDIGRLTGDPQGELTQQRPSEREQESGHSQVVPCDRQQSNGQPGAPSGMLSITVRLHPSNNATPNSIWRANSGCRAARYSVGEVVWGAVHGCPWWPGKILALCGAIDQFGTVVQQEANVSWFGSGQRSVLPVMCLSHFMTDFDKRHSLDLGDSYQDAVYEAVRYHKNHTG